MITFDPFNMQVLVQALMSPNVCKGICMFLICFFFAKFLLSLVKSVPIEQTDQYEAYRDDE